MYSFEEEEKIIKLIQDGLSIRELNKEYNFPIRDLLRLRKEIKIREEVKKLIENNQLEQAKKEVEKLKGINAQIFKKSILSKIAKIEGNKAEAKKLLEESLELKPDNQRTLKKLISISREECNIQQEKYYLLKLLELDPSSTRTVANLIRISHTEGNIEHQKRFLKKMIELDPDNQRALQGLESLKTREETETLKSEILQSEEDKELNNIEEARKIIYEDQDIIKGAEKIKELLENENSIDSTLVLAELYHNRGLLERGEKLLKTYKKSLDKNEQGRDIKIVNRAIELITNKTTKRYKWNEFWLAKQKIEEGKKDYNKQSSEIPQREEDR